ncbi:MAG: hypothetical protein L0Y71_00325 [Gemmataceae bacterium]|nr:hypothetical protein [Gemmataceae bacterium]
MKPLDVAILCSVFLAGFAGTAAPGEMKMALDSTTDPRLFAVRFARYGYNPMKTISIDPKGGVRFQLPAATPAVQETMLYSFFALAGDFEIVAGYEWTNVTSPREGHGVRCGFEVVVEGDPTPASMTIERGQWPEAKRDGYLVYRGTLNAEKKRMSNEEYFEPAKARKGKLAMRREKDEIVCLAANSPKEELRELCRLPFTERTIRKIRLFVDQGGSPTTLDIKFPEFCVRAEEITGGIPRRDQPFGWGRWLMWGGFAVVGTVLFILYRREKRAEREGG